MASPEPSPPPTQSSDLLLAKLASVLPKGYDFGVYHISTPPTRCEPLFHAPPGRKADRTFCESHFLAVSIDPSKIDSAKTSEKEVIIFALEIFIYTTVFASTFFVSKADSSGYLHLLNLPRGTPSPIRTVTSAFVLYLVEQRRRPGIQPVVSLFARAQSQYLFPGSVDNKGKHVLDDRGLVKWWCRVLDGIVGDKDKGYLVVPGLDQYEMRSFIPKDKSGGLSQNRWTLDHPLEKISRYTREGDAKSAAKSIPPRCLIPQYPDDPKARYMDELDDEVERAGQIHKGDSTKNKTGKSGGNGKKTKGPRFGNGMWTSVKTLDQFWEMMAFRQECSSGRLTGFIWVVFEEDEVSALPSVGNAEGEDDEEEDDEAEEADGKKVLKKSKPRPLVQTKTKKRKAKSKKLRGRIITRPPRLKTAQQHHYLTKRPATTRYYHWPAEGRGRLLVDTADYKRINELLLQLDFSTLAKSATSTHRWVSEAGVGSDWRLAVNGEAVYEAAVATAAEPRTLNGKTNDLSGLVKRKRTISTGDAAAPEPVNGAEKVNVLSTGLVRKKPKPV